MTKSQKARHVFTNKHKQEHPESNELRGSKKWTEIDFDGEIIIKLNSFTTCVVLCVQFEKNLEQNQDSR